MSITIGNGITIGTGISFGTISAAPGVNPVLSLDAGNPASYPGSGTVLD